MLCKLRPWQLPWDEMQADRDRIGVQRKRLFEVLLLSRPRWEQNGLVPDLWGLHRSQPWNRMDKSGSRKTTEDPYMLHTMQEPSRLSDRVWLRLEVRMWQLLGTRYNVPRSWNQYLWELYASWRVLPQWSWNSVHKHLFHPYCCRHRERLPNHIRSFNALLPRNFT